MKKLSRKGIEKRCNDCGCIKDITEFTKGVGCKDGHRNYCKLCEYKRTVKTIHICPICNIEFERARRIKQIFCSKSCAATKPDSEKKIPPPPKARKQAERISLICDCCGTAFLRELSAIKSHDKMGRKYLFCGKECRNNYFSGDKSSSWKGGVSRAYQYEYHSQKYKNWRDEIFKRDDFTCLYCGERGGYVEAHHIFRFSFFPEFRFTPHNGLTLCLECHRKTKQFDKAMRLQFFVEEAAA